MSQSTGSQYARKPSYEESPIARYINSFHGAAGKLSRQAKNDPGLRIDTRDWLFKYKGGPRGNSWRTVWQDHRANH